jgi:quercetin dioxygenase-like cupin family protein
MSKFTPESNELLQVQHYFAAGLYAKQMTINVGTCVKGHVHLFDHMSILAKGSVMVYLDGDATRYDAPAVVTIKQGKCHSIHPITDSVWYCLHATDLTDPDEIDEATSVRKPK